MPNPPWRQQNKVNTISISRTKERGFVRKRENYCYVITLVLYGSEYWKISEIKKRLEAREMTVYRRQLRIQWVEHVNNNEVLDE